MKFVNVQDISKWRLCVGCGACAYICPEKNITLSNILQEGIRPRIDENRCKKCGECLKVCPGFAVEQSCREDNDGVMADLIMGWGQILEVWEGYAADPEIRYHGSSGGLASALALYCIEKAGMSGLLHIGPNRHEPLRNKTIFSTSKNEILSRTGSRYSPASPCDSLDRVESAPEQGVFIGKPCDVAGLRKAQELKQELNKKTGLVIGIFCAGTPSMKGTLALLEKNNINPEDVEEIRYRGKGWPGKFAVRMKGEENPREIMTYMDAWGFVQKYRPYRCYLCPDGTSELADISCGDPWYRQIKDSEQGYSMALIRTERGRQMLQGAMKDGYVNVERAKPQILTASQQNLLVKRGAIWGRLFTMKAFGIPVPQMQGFSLFKNWLTLSMKEKTSSILGTAKRIMQRKYYRPAGG